MSEDIAPVDELVGLERGQLTFKRDLTLPEWMSVGEVFRAQEHSMSWWVGDWMNYGESKYGEKYSQALESTDYAEGTLRNAAYVAKTIPPPQRVKDLSWSHHYAVANIADVGDRQAMLAKALEQGWSVKSLQAEVRGLLGKPDPKPRGAKEVSFTAKEKITFEEAWENYTEEHGHDGVLKMDKFKMAEDFFDLGRGK